MEEKGTDYNIMDEIALVTIRISENGATYTFSRWQYRSWSSYFFFPTKPKLHFLASRHLPCSLVCFAANGFYRGNWSMVSTTATQGRLVMPNMYSSFLLRPCPSLPFSYCHFLSKSNSSMIFVGWECIVASLLIHKYLHFEKGFILVSLILIGSMVVFKFFLVILWVARLKGEPSDFWV